MNRIWIVFCALLWTAVSVAEPGYLPEPPLFDADTDTAMQATLQKKLGEDMPPYRILGACSPPLAHRAITAEPSIGLLLPCNVVVRQEHGGTVHVEFMDPAAVFNLVDNPAVQQLAKEVRERLDRVLSAL